MNSPFTSDLLIKNVAELATPLGRGPATGAAQGQLERRHDVDVLVVGGRIACIGTEKQCVERFPGLKTIDNFPVLDGRRCTLVPGFVDAHTHLPWAGSRENEFAQRLAGRTYLEIAESGGGILSTVAATRAASEDELVDLTTRRLDTMLAHGTTTAEVKSGYGLDLGSEMKQLRAIARAGAASPLDVVATLLAAHEFPPEFRHDRDGWVDEIVHHIVPAVADKGLARFCDVFCERGVFSVEQSRRVLEAGLAHGQTPRLHADEFVDSGAATLAAQIGAASADHLAAISDAGLAAMAEAGTSAVLLPGVNFFLMKKDWAPARRLIDAEVPVVLATDCNPGSSHTESLPFIVQLGIFHLRMTVEECLTAITLNAAHVLGLAEDIGSIEVGKRADLVLLDQPNLMHLGYHLGVNPVAAVVKGGAVVYDRSR